MSKFESNLPDEFLCNPALHDLCGRISLLVGEYGIKEVWSAIAYGIEPAIRDLHTATWGKTSGAPSVVKIIPKDKRDPKDRGIPTTMHERFPGADHERVRVKDGVMTFVSEPYGLGLDELRKMVAYCDKYGLDCHIHDTLSAHYPGRCLTVTIIQAGEGNFHKLVGL